MRQKEYSEGQLLFDKNLKGMHKAAVLLFFAVVFSPLLASAIAIASLFLPWTAPGHVWLIVTVGGAFVLYLVLAWFKSLIQSLRRNRSPWWIALFLFCVAVTCILPGYLCYSAIRWLAQGYQPAIWILEAALTYYVYGQYNFLNWRLPFFTGLRR